MDAAASILAHVRDSKVAGRNLTLLPDDVFLVSYPGSIEDANLRSIRAPLTEKHKAPEGQIGDVFSQSDDFLFQLPRPRVLLSHLTFCPLYKNVIYVVRDPRDVALSNYHRIRMGPRGDSSIERFVAEFVKEGFDPIAGSWLEHVGTWLATRYRTSGFLLIRYEDILLDWQTERNKITEFLDRASSEHTSTSTVQLVLRPCNEDGMRSGAWKSDLPYTCVQEIECTWGDVMRRLGYDLMQPLRLNPRDQSTLMWIDLLGQNKGRLITS